MSSQSLNAIIRRQYDRCLRLGKRLPETWALEEVHQFRVQVKRLRALLRLASSAKHSDFNARLPRNLKVYYRMTGVIRALQLQKIALEEAAVRLRQGAPASCLALLDDRIGMAKRMTGEYLASKDPLGKANPRWHSPIPPHMIGAAAEAFIIDKMKAMSLPDPSAMPGDEQLHAIRKAKKDLLYAWPCLPDASLEEAGSIGLPSRKDIRAQAQLLGDLHDIVIHLSLLKDKDFLLNTSPQSSRFLEAAQQLWLQDRQELLEKIKAQVFPAAPGPTPAADSNEVPEEKALSQAEVNPDQVIRENPLAPLNLEQQSYELHVE